MRSLGFLVALPLSPFASSVLANPTRHIPFGPSEAAARQNAFQIFNAVHSALRQWGSSLNHNGMSLFLATVPEGNLFYHGTHGSEPPTTLEWLAFEVEHAETFARAPGRRPPPREPGEPGWPGDGRPPPSSPFGQTSEVMQVPLSYDGLDGHGVRSWMDDPLAPAPASGYLHIYRVTSPLHLLYIDGMGAAKTGMGTLDTQDFLLRRARSRPMDERVRAAELCELVTAWGLDGVIRMEAGFEIIKCDFSKNLELLSARQRPSLGGERGRGDEGVRMLEYMRAVSQRYGGVGPTRARVDWGGMVSALWYPVDLSDPDEERAKAGLPRLEKLSDDELDGIKSRVEAVVAARLERNETGVVTTINWQSVVDMMVARYADKLRYLAEKVDSIDLMQAEVGNLVNLFIDYSKEDPGYEEAIANCASHYLPFATPATQEDRLVLAAIDEVSRAICSTLFDIRQLVIEDPEADEKSLEKAVAAVQELMGNLKWTKWRECQTCPSDEVCFVAMWPFGDTASHERPSCRNSSNLRVERGESYWRQFR